MDLCAQFLGFKVLAIDLCAVVNAVLDYLREAILGILFKTSVFFFSVSYNIFLHFSNCINAYYKTDGCTSVVDEVLPYISNL